MTFGAVFVVVISLGTFIAIGANRIIFVSFFTLGTSTAGAIFLAFDPATGNVLEQSRLLAYFDVAFAALEELLAVAVQFINFVPYSFLLGPFQRFVVDLLMADQKLFVFGGEIAFVAFQSFASGRVRGCRGFDTMTIRIVIN